MPLLLWWKDIWLKLEASRIQAEVSLALVNSILYVDIWYYWNSAVASTACFSIVDIVELGLHHWRGYPEKCICRQQ